MTGCRNVSVVKHGNGENHPTSHLATGQPLPAPGRCMRCLSGSRLAGVGERPGLQSTQAVVFDCPFGGSNHSVFELLTAFWSLRHGSFTKLCERCSKTCLNVVHVSGTAVNVVHSRGGRNVQDLVNARRRQSRCVRERERVLDLDQQTIRASLLASTIFNAAGMATAALATSADPVAAFAESAGHIWWRGRK